MIIKIAITILINFFPITLHAPNYTNIKKETKFVYNGFGSKFIQELFKNGLDTTAVCIAMVETGHQKPVNNNVGNLRDKQYRKYPTLKAGCDDLMRELYQDSFKSLMVGTFKTRIHNLSKVYAESSETWEELVLSKYDLLTGKISVEDHLKKFKK